MMLVFLVQNTLLSTTPHLFLNWSISLSIASQESTLSLLDAMDLQIVIPVCTATTPVESREIPVAVSSTNVSILSYAALRDRNLVNDMKAYTTQHHIDLLQTHPTDFLLYLLLCYQTHYALEGDAATRVDRAITTLQEAWYGDIER